MSHLTAGADFRVGRIDSGVETEEMAANWAAGTKSGNHVAPNDEHEKTDSANVAEASLNDEIRQRAYAIHIDRRGSHGYDFGDWLRAEQELREGYDSEWRGLLAWLSAVIRE